MTISEFKDQLQSLDVDWPTTFFGNFNDMQIYVNHNDGLGMRRSEMVYLPELGIIIQEIS